MIDGKAKLIRDDYCDGMGDCLPQCPTGAITFEEREAAEYDRAAVEANMKKREAQEVQKEFRQYMSEAPLPTQGCPGAQARTITRDNQSCEEDIEAPATPQLHNWPAQIKLAPIQAPYFDGAHLLIAADCTAFAYASFHHIFMRNKATLIGCPKLDSVDYSEKLVEILRLNEIEHVTIARMEVPCCGGLEMATKRAIEACGKPIPCQVVTISIDGRIL